MPDAISVLKAASWKYPELPSAARDDVSDSPSNQRAQRRPSSIGGGHQGCPNDPEPYVILGKIALQDRRVAEAAFDFDKAKQLRSIGSQGRAQGVVEQQMLNGMAQVAESREDWTVLRCVCGIC